MTTYYTLYIYKIVLLSETTSYHIQQSTAMQMVNELAWLTGFPKT